MRGEAEKKGMLSGSLNSIFFEHVLRHYHPRLFLHIWCSSRNVFPQPVPDDMGHLTGTAHAGLANLRRRELEGRTLFSLLMRWICKSRVFCWPCTFRHHKATICYRFSDAEGDNFKKDGLRLWCIIKLSKEANTALSKGNLWSANHFEAARKDTLGCHCS